MLENTRTEDVLALVLWFFLLNYNHLWPITPYIGLDASTFSRNHNLLRTEVATSLIDNFVLNYFSICLSNSNISSTNNSTKLSSLFICTCQTFDITCCDNRNFCALFLSCFIWLLTVSYIYHRSYSMNLLFPAAFQLHFNTWLISIRSWTISMDKVSFLILLQKFYKAVVKYWGFLHLSVPLSSSKCALKIWWNFVFRSIM